MINKQVLPESFDFGMPSVEIVNVGSKGLDKTAMVKRASAFDDILDKIEKKANRTYLHVITTGAFEKYGANANCMTADTRVITDSGTKAICDIQPGDLVLTAEGDYKPVLQVYSRNYTGDLYSIKVQGLPVPVHMTAEHPVRAIRASDMLYHYGRLHKGREERSVFEQNLDDLLMAETCFRPAESLECKDAVMVPERRFDFGVSQIPKVVHDMLHCKSYPIDENDLQTAYIYGLWLAEGCVSFEKKKPCKQKRRSSYPYSHASVIWTLNREHDAKSMAILCNFLGRYSIKLHYQDQLQVRHCRVENIEFGIRLTQLFGSGARGKFLHPAIFNMPDEWKLAFIGGYLDGDGLSVASGKSKGTVEMSTASVSLAYDLQALFMSLGRKASIARCFNRISNGCLGTCDHDIYQVCIGAANSKGLTKYCVRLKDYSTVTDDFSKNLLFKHKLVMRITGIESNFVENVPVYNLEVEDSHTYCVPFVVHNCDAWNGHAFDHVAPYPEDEQHKIAHFDGGLSKYHDDTYMHGGAVYQEHQTKTAGVDPSGEIIAARYNEPMQRGELIIAVDNDKWRDRLQKKASGKDIYLSIGASVPFDRCLLCHHQAKVASEHCSHFQKHRGQIFDCGEVACVMNDKPSFYDISGVNVPADKIAFVLRKVASTGPELTKTASLSHIPDMIATRRPMLLTKAASILSKLAEMEKKIEGIIEGDKSVDLEAFRDDDDAKKDLILRVENYPADEVIDSCNRKGILLSPGMLFKILGSDLEDGNILSKLDDDCCGDTTCIMRELEDDDEKNEELLDGSFDQHMPADLNLDEILNKFLPEFGASDGAINAKIIRITISPRDKKEQKKEASYNPMAQQALRRTYARYLVSFAERNDDQTCFNALMKVAALSK